MDNTKKVKEHDDLALNELEDDWNRLPWYRLQEESPIKSWNPKKEKTKDIEEDLER